MVRSSTIKVDLLPAFCGRARRLRTNAMDQQNRTVLGPWKHLHLETRCQALGSFKGKDFPAFFYKFFAGNLPVNALFKMIFNPTDCSERKKNR